MTKEDLNRSADAVAMLHRELTTAREEYSADERADEEPAIRSQYERRIAAIQEGLLMAEREERLWESRLRAETAEQERDRATTAAERERKRADGSERKNLIIVIAGIAATLLAGALPLMCASKPTPAPAPVNEVKVYPPSPQPAPVVNVQVLPAPIVAGTKR